MEVTIKGEPKEIAALVAELQERRAQGVRTDLGEVIRRSAVEGEAVHLQGEQAGHYFRESE